MQLRTPWTSAIISPMRGRVAWLLVLVVAIAGLMGCPPAADAQRGGRGRGWQGRGAPSTSSQPAEELRAGEYALDGNAAREAISRGEGRQALAYYERVAAEAEQHGDRLRAARAGHVAASTALRLGLFQKAITSGTRAIELFRAADLSPDDLGRLASTYAQVGHAYRHVGDLDHARKLFEEGLAVTGNRLRGRREVVVLGFLSRGLAQVAFAQKDYQTALARAGEAARSFEDEVARLGPRAPERRRYSLRWQAATALVTMGRAQTSLGQFGAAEATLDRALDHARAIKAAELEVDVLQARGNLALARSDWIKAVTTFQRAVALAGPMGRSAVLIPLNHGLAKALAALDHHEAALDAAREAVSHVEEVRGEMSDALLRTDFLEDKQAVYQQAVRLALRTRHPEEAFALAERGRARAFLDLLGSQTTLSKGRTRALVDEEVRLRTRLAEAQTQAEEIDSTTDESERGRALAETAKREYREFLERVRKESLEQASLMTVEPVTLPEIQALLPEGTTLLEYLVGEHDAIVWVVDRQRTETARIAEGRRRLVTRVREFRAAIAGRVPLPDVQAQAQALYRQLIGPVRGKIQGQRLLIVPHDVLHYLPFGALRSPRDRWLVEDFALGTLPSASVLRYLGGKGDGASAGSLVVGNPDLGAALALPWSEREARLVGQHVVPATVLVKSAATEAKVKGLLDHAGIVHFATHGELDEADPLSSALLLVPGEGEDGRLEVRELFGLDLHARLVVLSACETGLGKLSRGDELIGLQRGFLYAGTPAVVTTLWKVDDRASYELIRAFYRHLSDVDPTEALRRAQVETMRAFPDPFAWAAFGVTGSPR